MEIATEGTGLKNYTPVSRAFSKRNVRSDDNSCQHLIVTILKKSRGMAIAPIRRRAFGTTM